MTRDHVERIASNSEQVRKDFFCATIIDSFGWGMNDEQLEALYNHLFNLYVNCFVDCSFERFPQAMKFILDEMDTDEERNDFLWVDGKCPMFDLLMSIDSDAITREAIEIQYSMC